MAAADCPEQVSNTLHSLGHSWTLSWTKLPLHACRHAWLSRLEKAAVLQGAAAVLQGVTSAHSWGRKRAALCRNPGAENSSVTAAVLGHSSVLSSRCECQKKQICPSTWPHQFPSWLPGVWSSGMIRLSGRRGPGKSESVSASG